MNALKLNQPPPQDLQERSSLCFMQLTRLGDIIQLLTSIRNLDLDREKFKLSIIVREKFGRPLESELSKYFENIYFLDIPKWTNGLKKTSSLKKTLLQFLESISTQKIDHFFNLSFSKSSAYLASLITASHKSGPYFNAAESFSIKDKWSRYIYSNVMGTSMGSFNLVDIYEQIIRGSSKGTRYRPPPKLVTLPQIVIHPFASSDKKRWKASKWHEVIFKISRDFPDFTIIVVGSKDDLKLATPLIDSELLKNYGKKIKFEIGKKSIVELQEILKSSILFIGHDSMVGHLASYHGVRTITVSLGTSRAIETTPYGSGNLNIEPKTSCYPCFPSDQCSEFKCHSDIPFQVVTEVVSLSLKEAQLTPLIIENNLSPFHLSRLTINRSYIDRYNYFSLSNMTEDEASSSATFKHLYRVTWSYFLDEKELDLPIPKLSYDVYSELCEYLNPISHIISLCQYGQHFSKEVIEEISKETSRLEQVKNISEKIGEIDTLLHTVGKNYRYLNPPIDYFSLVKMDLKGKDIVSISESSFHAYQESYLFFKIMKNLLNIVLENTQYKKQEKNKPKENLDV